MQFDKDTLENLRWLARTLGVAPDELIAKLVYREVGRWLSDHSPS